MEQKNKPEKDPLFEAFEKAFPAPTISTGHQQRFRTKLKEPTQVQRPFHWFKIAVVALFCIGIGSIGTLYFSAQNTAPKSFLQAENYFTTAITTELNEIENINTATTAPLIEDAKKQLQRLQNDYIFHQQQFEEVAAHPKLLNAMITNLERQLDLVRELKQLIITIKKTKNETQVL